MSQKRYTAGEEIANSSSHGLGILLGIIAGIILMRGANQTNNSWIIISFAVYLVGMLSSYITSTWYHACTNEHRKALLRKFDHGAIYLHIAGTYTPFTLVVLRNSGAWGWTLFSFVWTTAIVGFILSFVRLKEHSNLETVCYVVMGGAILVAFKPLIDCLSAAGSINIFYWLIGGGASYVIGALFYSWTKMRYMHSIFHLFVLGGSICHIIAIFSIL
ncbi:hemolysin III family protein [uncultured Bacteroides sp.]|uniref:PAQR family membrane homeostasis protein TrhA n=1 Tax=uncultured Bacteroides sp. TaxID=162156 RepID=UPI002AAAB9C6|nr:hemolysin III family protein [uncultured Bacteroides sp.]